MRRRELLALLGATLTLPVVGLPAAGASRVPPRVVPNGARLVLVELAGANDGLNTLVPWRDDRYRAARPTLALGPDELLALDDASGLHAALRPLMAAHERGELALVQGLGYPRPNRSHFRSVALRERGGDGVRDARRAGWLTHAVEHGLGAREQDVDGMSLAGGTSLFASEGGRWLSAESVGQLLAPLARGRRPVALDHPLVTRMGVRFEALDATLARLRAKLERAPDAAPLPGRELGEQLRQILRFVAAGLDVPVYRVRVDGFDTHEAQRERHAARLALVAEALAAFRARLIALGEWRSTVVMSYSEFGRRLAENASGGTDHGTAAPQLVLGGRVRGGLYGAAVDLAPDALVDGDPVHTMDYRALYARALGGALGAGDAHLDAFADARLDRLIAA